MGFDDYSGSMGSSINRVYKYALKSVTKDIGGYEIGKLYSLAYTDEGGYVDNHGWVSSKIRTYYIDSDIQRPIVLDEYEFESNFGDLNELREQTLNKILDDN